MTIGTKIRQRREEIKMKQSVLATMVDIDQSTLVRFENDKNFPRTDTLQKIAKALEVEMQYFFQDEKNNCIIQHNTTQNINGYVFGVENSLEREVLNQVIETQKQLIETQKELIISLKENKNN